jgi:hypothetical protein
VVIEYRRRVDLVFPEAGKRPPNVRNGSNQAQASRQGNSPTTLILFFLFVGFRTELARAELVLSAQIVSTKQ